MRINRYDVYVKDYKNRTGLFIGSIPERREKPRGEDLLICGALIYARMTFGGIISDLNSIYVIPRK